MDVYYAADESSGSLTIHNVGIPGARSLEVDVIVDGLDITLDAETIRWGLV